VCAYSSTNAVAIVTSDRMIRLLVSMFIEAQRQMAETTTRPEANMNGLRAWYPPQKRDATVAEIIARTISRFLYLTQSRLSDVQIKPLKTAGRWPQPVLGGVFMR
jgi:hypothetical protein